MTSTSDGPDKGPLTSDAVRPEHPWLQVVVGCGIAVVIIGLAVLVRWFKAH